MNEQHEGRYVSPYTFMMMALNKEKQLLHIARVMLTLFIKKNSSTFVLKSEPCNGPVGSLKRTGYCN